MDVCWHGGSHVLTGTAWQSKLWSAIIRRGKTLEAFIHTKMYVYTHTQTLYLPSQKRDYTIICLISRPFSAASHSGFEPGLKAQLWQSNQSCYNQPHNAMTHHCLTILIIVCYAIILVTVYYNAHSVITLAFVYIGRKACASPCILNAHARTHKHTHTSNSSSRGNETLNHTTAATVRVLCKGWNSQAILTTLTSKVKTTIS